MHAFATIIEQDGVVIFPTDTVWGLGCSASSSTAIKKLYQIKKREPEKPTAILVGSLAQAKEYGIFNSIAEELAQKHWPGALTLIVKATDKVPIEIMGPDHTVGIRFPNFAFVQQLTSLLGSGLTTGSANFSGNNPPLKKEELDSQLVEKVDAVFEGECGGQPPSTIVNCTKPELHIIRQGGIQI